MSLMKLSLDSLQSLDRTNAEKAASEAFFRKLTTRVYSSLQSLSPQSLPDLHLHAQPKELDSLAQQNAETAFPDWQGIHIGLGFVARLDAAIFVLSAYLIENYLWQVSPLVLDTPADGIQSEFDSLIPFSLYTDIPSSLSTIVSLNDFPGEALSFYSFHLIPEAEAQDGYQKRPFQLIMEYLQETHLVEHSKVCNRSALARAIPKPLLDLSDFCDRFDASESIRAYLDPDKAPYLLKLHLQLLLDGLYFVLAHEVAHFQLGHFKLRQATVAAFREQEAAADATALALLSEIPGFQPRSLIIIFNFASHNEPEVPPDRMDHPLAHNRLLILAESLLAGPNEDALRSDVNAGLAMVPSRLETQYLTFAWQNEVAEDVDIHISSYSDMDYISHVLVYLDRPPRHAGEKDAFIENAFLLSHLAYKIQFEVRDRINPEKVYAWGGAGYHPTIRSENIYTANRDGTVFSRLHLSIPAPPEFCVKWPNAEFAIKKLEIMYRAPDLRSREEGENAVRFFYEPIELEMKSFIQSLPSLDKDPSLRSRLLLAARRYCDYNRYDESIQIYQWLYLQDPESLPYRDLLNLVSQLMDTERLSDAAEIARWATGSQRLQRPGFHYVLAVYNAISEDLLDAYEEAFLEMALFGVYGEMFDDAREICAGVAPSTGDAVMNGFRTFLTHRDAAGQALERSERERALDEFLAGKNALLACQKLAPRDYVFLFQCISDVTLAIAELKGGSFEVAEKAAQAVLALMPDFVPALINQAKVALLQSDRKAANAIWRKANAIAPFNSLVFDYREEFTYESS